MPVWIKICGTTSHADAQLAVDAGADAVGFVLAPSPRQVTPAAVRAMVSRLPPHVEKIGVFVDADLDTICTIVQDCGLTGVQLHFDTSPALPGLIRERLGPPLRILQVVHFQAELLTEQVDRHAQNPHINALLVDSRTAMAAGGTGTRFDWAEARRTVFAEQARLKLVAAGGLNPANIADAIAILQPWGVDVVSGVEAAPGRKHPEKVRNFVAKARAAQP
jgi:phosphoribosylanthranilate isomerase